MIIWNWRLSPVREKRSNSPPPPWMLIRHSKLSNLENRTELSESRGLERNGPSENNGEILSVVSPELKL
jgi:hypothetical protein